MSEAGFIERQFPCGISAGSTAGPKRRTEVVELGSGYEERNSRWADSRREYNAAYGVKSLNDLAMVLEFFGEARGKLYGFRWKDYTDFKSCLPDRTTTNLDQEIGVGTGSLSVFQVKKRYGNGLNPWYRDIKKIVAGSFKLSVNGVSKNEGTHYNLNYNTGSVVFVSGNYPGNLQLVKCGYEFDVPARFNTDDLSIDLGEFKFGKIPNIPVIEIRV
jgi:uncharacterized protein (TIGR02217 family)